MPFKYQRTYQRKYKKHTKQEKKAIVDNTDINDSAVEIGTTRFTRDSTFQQVYIKSPDIIGSDWNDTFDKLKIQGPVQVMQPEIVNSDPINAPCNSSSYDGGITDSPSLENGMKEQKSVSKLMTDSESEVGSLNLTVGKTHSKYDFNQKFKRSLSHGTPYNNSDFDHTSLCHAIRMSFRSISLKPNACYNKPIAESTPINRISNTKNHNLQPLALFRTPDNNLFNNITNQYKKLSLQRISNVDINIEKVISNSKKKMKENCISATLSISKAKNLIERRRRKRSVNIEKYIKTDCSNNNKNARQTKILESKIYDGNAVSTAFDSGIPVILSNFEGLEDKCCNDISPNVGTKHQDNKIYTKLDKNSNGKAVLNQQNDKINEISTPCNIEGLNSSKDNSRLKSEERLKQKFRFCNTDRNKKRAEQLKYTVKENEDNTKSNVINILPGKKWRRSLNIYIQNNCFSRGAHINENLSSVHEDKQNKLNDTSNVEKSDIKSEDINDNISKLSIVDKQLSYISIPSDDLGYSVESNTSQKSVVQSRPLFSNIGFGLNELKDYDPSPATSCEVVLRRCGQTEPVPFSRCYPDSALQKCHKIGEGLFGEVFLYKDLQTRECSVIKIIPIEGSLIVNGEKQKKFDEILSEIIIVMELSDLRTNNDNTTSGFSQLKKINCVKGKYPETLLHLWELYEEQFGSENDNPQMFGDDQLYVILELGNGGRDLEAFQFTNAKQSLSIFQQVALTLAVAESALEFEHRDLHWGNVLIVSTSEKITSFKIDGHAVSIPLHGVKATIIDFTFSRITINGQALFSDLGADEELFSADGDYQFDIYRHMRKKNQNNWRSFQPYSNILWLHYLADKMISGARYTHTKSKLHSSAILELQFIKDSLLSYNNVNGFLEDFDYFS